MHLDVVDLRNFYYRTQLGRVAQRAIRDTVMSLWPDAQGQTVAGFGFAVPLLRPYLGDARRVIGLMPGPQGVMPWPAGMPNVSVLCEETNWPLSTGFVDKLVVMHGLEVSEHPSELLEECSRVLGPGGRALFIVPNRSGLWARRDGTPFGFGQALFLLAARGAAEAPRLYARTQPVHAVRAAVEQAVLVAHGRFLGRDGAAVRALARRGGAGGRGVQADLCTDAARPARRGAQAAAGAGRAAGAGAGAAAAARCPDGLMRRRQTPCNNDSPPGTRPSKRSDMKPSHGPATFQKGPVLQGPPGLAIA